MQDGAPSGSACSENVAANSLVQGICPSIIREPSVDTSKQSLILHGKKQPWSSGWPRQIRFYWPWPHGKGFAAALNNFSLQNTCFLERLAAGAA